MLARNSTNYGKGMHRIDASDVPLAAHDLLARLLATFQAPDYRPPVLPSVALELLELSRHPDVERSKILGVLEKDLLIAGQVLKVAQSAMFTTRVAVSTLDQAVSRLGMRTLADIFLQVSVSMRVFRAPGFDEPMNALRRHSTVAAHLSRSICTRARLPNDNAFLCGLLHDVGIAACIITIAEGPRQERPSFAMAWPAILEAHASASRRLAQLWRLPADVEMALAHHHDPRVGGRIYPLAAALVVADYLAYEAGCGMESDPSELVFAESARAIRLSPQDITELRAEAIELCRPDCL